MSEHIQHTIDELKAKRDAIVDVIGKLEWFQREFPHTAAAVTPAKKAAKDGRTDGRTEQGSRQRAARSRPDDAVTRRTLAEVVQSVKKEAPGHASSDVVLKRDIAIKARLKKGPAKFADLRAAMPNEPGMDDGQIVSACSNALTRLRLKKEIKQVDEGWALA